LTIEKLLFKLYTIYADMMKFFKLRKLLTTGLTIVDANYKI
jgi:hypothetical protein